MLILIIYVWQAHARPAFLRVRVAISNVNASLAENLDGVRVVQSMSRQKKNLVAFEQLNQRHLDTNLRAQRLSSSLMPAVEMFMSFGLATTIVFGGRLVLSSALGVGQLIQFTLYIQRFFDPIRSLTQQFTQLQRAMASGARIFDLLDAEADLFDAPDAQDMPRIQGAIHYENVSFAYEPGKPVLSNIDLDIEPGQTVALVGRTGAGKTTMAALISRFYDVTRRQPDHRRPRCPLGHPPVVGAADGHRSTGAVPVLRFHHGTTSATTIPRPATRRCSRRRRPSACTTIS